MDRDKFKAHAETLRMATYKIESWTIWFTLCIFCCVFTHSYCVFTHTSLDQLCVGVGPFSLRIGTFLPQYVLLMYRLCIMDVLCWDTYRSMYLGVSKCIILYPLRNTCILVRYMCIVCIGNVSWMYYGLGPRYMSNTRAIHVYPAGQYVGYT